jgi:predicted GH43/DUF377 family glycosyl hydrolase
MLCKDWYRKGLIFKPDSKNRWNKSHAQVPTPLVLDDRIRVYYSSRDKDNISRISFVDLDLKDPEKIINKHSEVVLDIGKPGTFDDCGVMPSWVLMKNNFIYLYYIGWNVRNTVPYYNSVGLAISNDDGLTFKKYSLGPLWDRNVFEPYFSASTCVIPFNTGWICYYLSCTEYREYEGKMEPRYHIKIATSEDGINWKRDGLIAIDYKHSEEAGIVKASVLKINSEYHMWYSYRNFKDYRNDEMNSYSIGYAKSSNGIDWARYDGKMSLNGLSTWDNLMEAYPHVIKLDNRLLMFYNGNGFGETGFGYAERLLK